LAHIDGEKLQCINFLLKPSKPNDYNTFASASTSKVKAQEENHTLSYFNIYLRYYHFFMKKKQKFFFIQFKIELRFEKKILLLVIFMAKEQH
jgi:hypothetical protein